MESAIRRVDELMEPFKHTFFRAVTDDDLIHLWEIKMGRILKFNSQKADEKIARLDEEIARLEYDLEHIVEYPEEKPQTKKILKSVKVAENRCKGSWGPPVK